MSAVRGDVMEQQILYGFRQLSDVLRDRKLFLVHGRSFASLTLPPEDGGNAPASLPSFFERSDVTHFTGFSPNPLYEEVEAGVEAFRASKADVIVAVGGGSAIDVAKCIKLFCRLDGSVNYLGQEWSDTKVPLIAVPTTAGTGSESTRHAVIYYEGKKQSVSHPSIVPDIAVLEPALLKNLPLYQKKCTMLDALCQGIESWWSVNSTEESREYSRNAVEGIRDHWQAYIEEGDTAAAGKILEAANMSGRAINITATTAPHAMSYKLTSMYHLPHGHAVALAMAKVWPYTIEHAAETSDPRGAEFLREILKEIPVGPEWFSGLLEQLGMQAPVSGTREQDVELLADSVNPLRLKNHPVGIAREEMKRMYGEIVK